MEYRIVQPNSDHPLAGKKYPRVEIDGRVYPLFAKGGYDARNPDDTRQFGGVLEGCYGEVNQAYAKACVEVDAPCKLGHSGPANVLGDWSWASIPEPIA